MGQHPVLLVGILAASIAIVGCDSKTGSTSGQASQPTGARAAEPAAPSTTAPVFFDDFSYPEITAFHDNGWKARTETGPPGIKGAIWSAQGLSFITPITAAFFLIAFILAVKGGRALLRSVYCFSISAWTFFILYFYMHGMARKVAENPPSPPLSTDIYISGVVAYEVSLLETKIVLILIVLSLALLVVFPASRNNRS